MKTYLSPQAITLPVNLPLIYRRSLLLLILSLIGYAVSAQELVFKNAVLESGVAGTDGAVYRFSNVRNGGTPTIDALITINSRSNALVSLVSLDLSTTGHDKAFQPQVSYNNNTTPDGVSDWWMEFGISFVQSGSTTKVNVDSFNLTALDIDGNGDKINEWVSFYNNKSFLLENNSVLVATNLSELVSGVSTIVGKKFDGPVQNYNNIDTGATNVMVTNYYKGINTFRMRVGGHSTGVSGASARMYSFWFKSFSYQSPVQFTLPLVLLDFNATHTNNKAVLNWVTGMEKSLSHFVVERSVNGIDYSDAGMIIANGNSSVKVSYSFADALPAKANGVIYYRLKMVDQDGKFQRSTVKLIRIGDAPKTLAIAAYPNPVTTELRISLPESWQNKKVTLNLFSSNGQLVKQVVANSASQTEVMNVADITNGLYIVKATNGTEIATERIVKTK